LKITGIPSNIILTRIRWPSAYLGLLTFCFGVAALVTSRIFAFWHLLCLRILLGICQAGVFSASIFLCTRWYTRQQLALRISCFYFMSNISTMLAGPLAAAISKLDGKLGISGWRWIYVIIGSVAMLVGVLDAFFLPANPEVAGWLREEERSWLQNKDGDQAAKSSLSPNTLPDEKKVEGFTIEGMKAVFSQWRVWAQCLLYMNAYIIALGAKLSTPSLLKAAGYSVNKAQILSAVPSATASVTAITGALLSDKLMVRGPFVFGPAVGLAACFLGLLITTIAGEPKPKTLLAAFAFIGLFFGPLGPLCSS
jgi:sugar phosphate permease